MKKLFALMLAISMLVGGLPAYAANQSSACGVTIVPADEQPGQLIEPEVNPDYIDWQNGKDFGEIIPPKYKYERESVNRPQAQLFSAYPTKYDPRDESAETNSVTPVKNQNPLGSCWAFGATAALESFAEKQFFYYGGRRRGKCL